MAALKLSQTSKQYIEHTPEMRMCKKKTQIQTHWKSIINQIITNELYSDVRTSMIQLANKIRNILHNSIDTIGVHHEAKERETQQIKNVMISWNA